MRNPIAHLPKSLQALPAVKALTLKVFPGDTMRHFKVPGSNAIYDVHEMSGVYHCSCLAAQHGAQCAHSLAAQNYCQQRKEAT